MFCQKCGTQNVEGARFCKNCGAPLHRWQQMQGGMGTPSQPVKRTNKKWIAAAGGILLAAVVMAGAFAFRSYAERKDYENYIAQAEKYLDEMDYESAEAAYMKAIEIDPKQEDPYLGLADVYIAQEDFGKAQKILSQGEKAVLGDRSKTSKDSSEAQDDGKSKDPLKEKVEEVENANQYEWAVEPEIQADDIYYIQNENTFDYPRNDLSRQMDTSYAVIKKGDSYGLIGMDGKLAASMDYQGVAALSKYYLLERKEPLYDPEYQTEMTDYYFLEEEQAVKPAVAVIGDAGNYSRGIFYYCDGLHNTGEFEVAQGYMEDYQKKPDRVIPVKQAKSIYDGSSSSEDWYEDLESKYALCDPDGKLLTDFVYDECGSSSSGLLAVKKDGKWGYVNEKGEEVIPIKYDASWCYDTYVFSDHTQDQSERIESCYAATDGYVPLCVNGKWELRDHSGKLVISSGIFEEIRPVYDGRCWVKKDGKWGVLKLEEEEQDQVSENEDWKVIYFSYIQSTMHEGWAGYRLIYLNDDQVPELYLMGSTTAQGDQICTYYDGRLETQNLGNGGLSYLEKENLFCDSTGRMDVYYDRIYQIQDGHFVVMAEGKYGAKDNTNVQTDADGNPVYQYSWDGEQMSKTQYEQRFQKLFDRQKAVRASEGTVSASEIITQIDSK